MNNFFKSEIYEPYKKDEVGVRLKEEYNPCLTCPNDPRNGGSGVCLCTLGTPKIKC